MRAYKFYSKRWGLEALYRRRLKIATAPELNDPFEFKAVSFRVRNDRAALSNWKKDMFSDKGLICFSKGWGNPVIWSHYAESHKGLALGFDIQDDIAMRVHYVENRLKMPPELRSGKGNSSAPNFSRSMVTTKFHHWAYEDEVRVFVPLSGDHLENGFYFEPFSKEIILKEVIIGALYDGGGNIKLNDDLLGEGINLTTSRLAFKSFAVVRQKNQQRWKSL